ncbi:hypothetical protein GS492_25130 [Rhodococcus hoagii]|nr:hypothetical protein [Prescottella equi]NKR75895.1 hypothetical protein [Prescottella equi]
MTDTDHSNFWPDHIAAQQQDDDRILDTADEFRCDCRRHAWTTLFVWCCVIGVVAMFAAIGWGAP